MIKNEIEVFQKQINPVIQKAEELTIKTAEDMGIAVETLSNLNKFTDKVAIEKAKIIKPLMEAVKVERDRWRPLETLYGEAVEVLRGKMTKYQTLSVNKAFEKGTKIAEEVASGKIDLDKAIGKLAKIEDSPKKLVTDAGSVNFIAVKKFEVVDMFKLPMKYHIANEPLIRTAMKEGVELEGVKYWTEQQVRNTR